MPRHDGGEPLLAAAAAAPGVSRPASPGLAARSEEDPSPPQLHSAGGSSAPSTGLSELPAPRPTWERITQGLAELNRDHTAEERDDASWEAVGQAQHPNYPLVEPDRNRSYVPAVPATRGRPTRKDAFQALCCECPGIACSSCCGLLTLLVLVMLGTGAISAHVTRSGPGYKAVFDSWTESAPAQCPPSSTSFLTQMTDMTECNACTHGSIKSPLNSFNAVCDEPSSCDRGSDRFDCEVLIAEEQAIESAYVSTGLRSWGGIAASYYLTLPIFIGSLLFLLCSHICGSRLHSGTCSEMRATEVPVLADYLFELVHSRSLALLGQLNLFIVLVLFLNPLFDTKLCEDTFTVTPMVFDVGEDTWPAANWNAAEDGFPAPIWPSAEDLPPAVAIFRRPYESTKYALITLFLGRFLCSNVANSRWRAAGDHLTRVAILLSTVLAVYSLVFLGDDLSYCKWPASTAFRDSSTSVCTVNMDDDGGRSMLSGQFAKDCDAQSATQWDEVAISFAQRLEVRTAEFPSDMMEDKRRPHDSALTETQDVSIDWMPTRKGTVWNSFYNRAQIQAQAQQGGQMFPQPPERDQPDSWIDSEDGSWSESCIPTDGTLMYAVAGYIKACEEQDTMWQSTLLVITLFLLNLVEVYLLIVMAADGVGGDVAALTRLPMDVVATCWSQCRGQASKIVPSRFSISGPADQRRPDAKLPVRLLTAIALSWVLVTLMSTEIAQMSDQMFASLSQLDGVWTSIAELFSACDDPDSVCNPYLKAHKTVPEYKNFPPFNDLNDDCPAGTAELFERTSAIVSQPEFWQLVFSEFSGDAGSDLLDRGGAQGQQQRRLLQHGSALVYANTNSSTSTRRIMKECPPFSHGAVVNGAVGCVCDDDFVLTTDGTMCVLASTGCVPHAQQDQQQCECESGFEPNDAGTMCLPESSTCAVHAKLNAQGTCMCDEGYRGATLTPPCASQCEDNEHFIPPQYCACDYGYVFISDTSTCEACSSPTVEPNRFAIPAVGGGCTCVEGKVWKDRSCTPGKDCECESAVAHLLEEEEVGMIAMCLFEWARRVYEPLPFCAWYAAVLCVIVGACSTVACMRNIRAQLNRVHELVEDHWEPGRGFPLEGPGGGGLSQEDRSLLGGEPTGADLKYRHIPKLPTFLGLFVGNFVAAFAVYWATFVLLLYLAFSKSTPLIWDTLLLIALPIAIEIGFRSIVWRYMLSLERGILHPRLFTAADLFFSLLGAATGPIKTIGRLLSAFFCLFFHMFRSDVLLMVDTRFTPMDPHYRATLGLVAAYRVQCEYTKAKRTASAGSEPSYRNPPPPEPAPEPLRASRATMTASGKLRPSIRGSILQQPDDARASTAR